MNKKDLEYFKTKLEKEQNLLEDELKTVGRINPSNPNDWEPTPTKISVDSADENEVAGMIEEYEDNSAILKQLETQLNEVKAALDRIDKGTYGICEVTKEPIERDRLEANPSARTKILQNK
jgi:RNA polymerase-binding transcription factor DksA